MAGSPALRTPTCRPGHWDAAARRLGPPSPCLTPPSRSDGDAEDGEQGPIWTFPPTIRPSPHGKLHKGTALLGTQKVCVAHQSQGEAEGCLLPRPLLSPVHFVHSAACRAGQAAASVPVPVHAGAACLWGGEMGKGPLIGAGRALPSQVCRSIRIPVPILASQSY